MQYKTLTFMSCNSGINGKYLVLHILKIIIPEFRDSLLHY